MTSSGRNKIQTEKTSPALIGAKKSSPFFRGIVQPKLTINQPNDVYEQQADAVAEKVLQMNSNDSVPSKFFSPRISTIQRKCSHCEEEERKMQRKELNEEEGTVDHDLEKYIDNLDSKGQSLPGEVRNFYEPRIGYDFSKVKIHTDSVAAKSAQSINALAYTSGNNIVFNNGQYSPDSTSGKKLLGHELTHVVQQSNSIQPSGIQRMSIGTGDPPIWPSEYNLRVVPSGERDRVRSAISIVRNILNNPREYDDCIRAFNEHCPGDSQTAFVETFNNAVLWRIDNDGANGRGDILGHNIAYTQDGYNQGPQGLAQTLVHEMGHNCGIDEDHYLAELSANFCIAPEDEIGIRVGIGLNTPAVGVAFAYRRLIDLALSGQLQLSLGVDLDLLGLAAGIAGEARGYVNPSVFEFGSLSAGLRERINLWGGEGFGGITFGQEVGIDAGRFRVVRETGPEEFEYGVGFIVQSTLGAEFYIPANPPGLTFSAEVGYRYVRPLNAQAQDLHQLVFGVHWMF